MTDYIATTIKSLGNRLQCSACGVSVWRLRADYTISYHSKIMGNRLAAMQWLSVVNVWRFRTNYTATIIKSWATDRLQWFRVEDIGYWRPLVY